MRVKKVLKSEITKNESFNQKKDNFLAFFKERNKKHLSNKI